VMSKPESMERIFDHRSDGLERTGWILSARYDPEREGSYEVCAWVGADVARCHWDGEKWWAASRLAGSLRVGHWRGITEESYLRACAQSQRSGGG